MRRPAARGKHGSFTIVELLVAVAISVILALASLGVLAKSKALAAVWRGNKHQLALGRCVSDYVRSKVVVQCLIPSPQEAAWFIPPHLPPH